MNDGWSGLENDGNDWGTFDPQPQQASTPLNSVGKRVREVSDVLSPDAPAQKSARPTPDPTTRPSSQSSLGFSDMPPDLLALLGGDPDYDLREMMRIQKEVEEESARMRESRRRQEERDAEYARQLQEEFSFQPLPTQSFGSSASRTYSQGLLDGKGKMRRPSPPPQPTTSRPPPQPAPVFKKEYQPVYGTSSRDANEWSNIVDLEGSDEDFSFIDSSQFTPNNRLPKPKTSGNMSANTKQAPQIVDLEGLGQGPSGYRVMGHNEYNNGGSSSGYMTPLDSNGVHGSAGSNVYGNIRSGLSNGLSSIGRGMGNAYNAALGVLDDTISSYPTPTSGYGSTLPANGHSPAMPGLLPGGFSGVPGLPWDPLDPLDAYDRYGGYGEYGPPGDSAHELKELLNNIRPDEDLGAKDSTGSPADMAETANLYLYQQKGLAWLTKMEEGTNKGGILADDMGLGKTIQAIALMVSRRSEDRNRKTTLIVAPVALIKQWESEVKIKVKPDRRLSTFIFHGSARKTATWQKLKQFDVVITTYGTLATEHKRMEEVNRRKKGNPNWVATATDRLALLGEDCKWYRVILDEAQNVKNKSTRSAMAVREVQAITRWCMTGTPMMNNVEELFSLIQFLRIKPYCESDKFNYDIKRPLKSHSEHQRKQAMQRLQTVLKAILLRRTKKSTFDGKPLIVLPDRTTNVDPAEFSEDELNFYRALESQTQLQFNKYLKAGTVGKNYSNVLVLLLRLRQACCHPHLIKDFATAAGADQSIDELQEIAQRLPKDTVKRIIENPIADCPICMDSADNYTIFHPCGHSTCPECFCKISSDPTRQVAENDAQATAGGGFAFKCHQCRSIIKPKSVTDYQMFKKIWQPDLLPEDDRSKSHDEAEDQDSDSDSSDEEVEDDDDDGEDLDDFVVDDEAPIQYDSDDLDDVRPSQAVKKEEVEDGMDRVPVHMAEATRTRRMIKDKDKKVRKEDDADNDTTEDEEVDQSYRDGKTPFEKSKSSKPETSKKGKEKTKRKGKGKEKKRTKPRMTLGQLKRESMRNRHARQRYLRRLEKDYESSAKIDRAINILREIKEKGQGEKTIVFSQFTSLLDLIEVPVNRENWTYRRYDGSMNANQRNDAVMDFTNKPEVKILLVSLKAGNAGLNLTAANQIILLDPFW